MLKKLNSYFTPYRKNIVDSIRVGHSGVFYRICK